MQRAGFSLWVKVAFALTFLVVVSLGIVTYRNTTILQATDRLVAQSYHVRELAESLLSLLKDAETAQRGYLLTNDQDYLPPYDKAVAKLKPLLNELRELTPADQELHQQLDRLEALSAERLEQMQNVIALREQTPGEKGLAKAQNLLLNNRGKDVSNSIQSVFSEIMDRQRELLGSREQEAARRAEVSHNSIVIGHTLAVILMILAGMAMLSDRRHRGEAEEQLETNQRRLSAIINSAMDAIVTIDEQSNVVLMNPAAETMFGWKISDAIGRTIDQFVPERLRPDLHRQLHNLLESALQISSTLEGVLVVGQRADGEEFPIDVSVSKTTVRNQRLLTFMIRDMSEKVASQRQIREQAAMLDQVRDAIHLCDTEGRILYWNRGAETLYGWRSDEAVGNTEQQLMAAKHAPLAREAFRITAERDTWSAEVLQLTKHGREISVEERRTLIRDESGLPSAQLVFDIDVTDRRKAEALQRRSQRLESIGTLAGGIAHDLNNVLTPILMGVRLLAREQTTDKREATARTVQAAAERGSEMIQQLLSFAGGREGRRQAVKPADIVGEVQGILEHTLPKSIELHVDLMDRLKPILGDSTELSQLMLNLCINSRDAMPQGGYLTIAAENVDIDERRVRANPDLSLGTYVMLSVSDTGVGIPPDLIDKVFDPFFTTKPQGKGTGLGLATCLGIVRSHGGAINIYSEPDCGTEFTIYLPVAESSTAEIVPLDDTALPQGNGELIMLVDDEVIVLDIARATLEANGYQVLSANSGNEAISILREAANQVQVAIVDMMMPGMDGITTIRELRDIEPSLRIVSSSGLRTRGRIDQALEGNVAFLPKPYSDRQLLLTLRHVLSEAKAAGISTNHLDFGN